MSISEDFIGANDLSLNENFCRSWLRPMQNLQQHNIVVKGQKSPVIICARNLANLLATVPSRIFHCDECVLNAFINKDGATTFTFTVKDNATDPETANMIITDIMDKLSELCLHGDVDGLIWNPDTKSVTAKTPEAFFEMFVDTLEYFDGFNTNMAAVIFSSALSIYNDYEGDEEDMIEKLHSPDQQLAIVRAIKSIVSTFEDTDDFTVIPQDTMIDGTNTPVFSFEISRGQDSPISFEKRYATLHRIYDTFEATDALFSRDTEIGMHGCQTAFSISTLDLASLERPLVFLFKDTDIMELAKDNKARLFINPSELHSVLNDPNRGLKHRAFQH